MTTVPLLHSRVTPCTRERFSSAAGTPSSTPDSHDDDESCSLDDPGRITSSESRFPGRLSPGVEVEGVDLAREPAHFPGEWLTEECAEAVASEVLRVPGATMAPRLSAMRRKGKAVGEGGRFSR